MSDASATSDRVDDARAGDLPHLILPPRAGLMRTPTVTPSQLHGNNHPSHNQCRQQLAHHGFQVERRIGRAPTQALSGAPRTCAHKQG